MKGDRAWVEHEIQFKAEQILDSSFDQELLKNYPIDKADEIFKQHFVVRAEATLSKNPGGTTEGLTGN